jgi:hypothetical protein
MPTSPSKRDAKLRLALSLAEFYATRPTKPDPVTRTTEQVLPLLRRLADLQQRYQLCYGRNWSIAARTLANRQAAQLRELSYVLSGLDRSPPPIRPVVSVGHLYRDLQALEEEFGELVVSSDLHTLSVVTDPIVLESIALGRFRIDLNLDRFHYGRLDGDAVRAIALEPNPAASNDEITHPHVQGGQICLGEGSVMVRQALTEGRLYDALLVVRSVLMTYNDASPYLSLDRWHGRSCDECEELTPEDELYSCNQCDNRLCGGCEHVCTDCDLSYCRRCLSTDGASGDLLCAHCLEERERAAEEEAAEAVKAESEDELPDALPVTDPSFTPQPEMTHATITD